MRTARMLGAMGTMALLVGTLACAGPGAHRAGAGDPAHHEGHGGGGEHAGHGSACPVAALEAEHDAIGRVAAAAAQTAFAARTEGRLDPQRAEKFLTFFTGFVDECHHAKEEKHLFPALSEHRRALLAELRTQHERGRALLAALRAALPGVARGDAAAVAAAADALEGYAGGILTHIAAEDGALLPAARADLDGATARRVAQGFDHVEHEELGEGAHERLHALALELSGGGEPH